MELLCPECRGALVTSDGQSARCSVHGGEYRILFSRWRPPAPPRPAAAEGAFELNACAQHSNVMAVQVCRECGKALCELCTFPLDAGKAACADCFARITKYGGSATRQDPETLSRAPAGVYCVQHSHLAAVRQCRRCGSFMCATCDFEFPGGIHLCPSCATSSQVDMSPKRRRFLYASYGLAIWCTVIMALVMVGAFHGYVQTPGDEQMFGLLLTLIVLVPSIAGLAFGASAMSRPRSPISVWIATIWNGIMLGAYVLLCIIGTFS